MLLTRIYPFLKLMTLIISILLIAQLADRSQAQPSESDADTITRVENYLNAIETLKADFLQVAPDSSLSEGTVYIKRPGRLRVDYDPPVPILIVSDGRWLTLIDYELKEVSRWPLDDTPLKVLVKGDLDLNKDVRILGIARDTGLIKITVKSEAVPGQERISFLFSDAPLELRQWEVIDGKGRTTRVALANTRTNVSLESDLFTYDDPRPPSRQRRTR